MQVTCRFKRVHSNKKKNKADNKKLLLAKKLNNAVHKMDNQKK